MMPADRSPNFDSIPVFDLQQFIDGSAKERDEFVYYLRNICHRLGFFYLKNHGLPSSMLKKMLALTRAFFDLPQAEKDKISIDYSPRYRGYGKLRAETTLGIPDYKESYDLGLEQAERQVTAEQPYLILHGKNQWPSADTLTQMQWKETMLEYMDRMQKTGECLLAAISLTLDLPENYFGHQFSSNTEDAFVMLRLLRYPPGRLINQNGESELGVGPHIDVGCLVLLLQDDIGGLQVQTSDGNWLDVPPIEDTLVVNIGEMLQIWSNNYFQATPHRVINRSSKIRHSIPFFLEPNLDTLVRPLPINSQWYTQMNRPQIAPDTAVLYGQHMLRVYQRSFKNNSIKYDNEITKLIVNTSHFI
ncbi:TPA: isopenicillin N synthase family oxygenase [Legionella pneumophila]|nr:isopenicillin N synthase family oxygenase [Legionella pneumophila]HAT2137346.1 isopenicillin N synthase family oxygenase [Legionella pneumophila]HAT2146608.1 isopenicillin N synthase family oxygenase [Legionella pneumophila]HAT2161726.1 isopenicillin N synthase family oxygenase [Legionella pneumophila]HAT3987110.1 isopenicillin N synthase family oxygenase [Legionella pneumophila]